MSNAYEKNKKLCQRDGESLGQYIISFQITLKRLHILEHPLAPSHTESIAKKFKKSLNPNKFMEFIIYDNLHIAGGGDHQ